jgi:hypothetical protein
MTLVISAKFRNVVVIQADGQSNRAGHAASSTLQKIFPIAGSCIAISHSGLNSSRGIEVARLIQSISFAECKGQADVADAIAKGIGGRIPWCACEACALKRQGVNFLIDGFDKSRRQRRLKLIWDWNLTAPRIEDLGDAWGHAHGEGEAVQWGNPPIDDHKATLDEIAAFVDGLFKNALTRTSSEVGGHIHSLKITTRGTEWHIAPLNAIALE